MYDSKVVLFKVKLFSCRPAALKLRKPFYRRYLERKIRMKAAKNIVKET